MFTDEIGRAEAMKNLEVSLGDIKPEHVHVDEPELEDVFVALLLREATGQEVPSLPSSASRELKNSKLAIEAKDLVRDFGPFRAVDRVSFQVRAGEIFGLLGANGAGKTTVIKMLNGIMPPTGGQGWVAGADMKTAGETIKERIGYMSQAFSLYLDLTVNENIRLFAGIYGLDREATKERLAWIVSMAGLKGYESSLTGRLPMGVRQRLALGCALVHRPPVLFLDEPTSGVDPLGRRHFWDILSRLAMEEGVAILITTHYMSEAEHCDHLALMYAGRIVAEGSPAAMKDQVEHEAGHLLEVTTDQPGEALQRLAQAGFVGAALFGTKIHLLSKDPSQEETRLRKRSHPPLSCAGRRGASTDARGRICASRHDTREAGTAGDKRSGCMNLRRIAAVASKEWRETIRDRMFVLLAFLLPVSWMIVFGYGLVQDVENIPFAVLDRDQSALSRDYLYRFVESRYFNFKGEIRSENEADALLQSGKIRMVIMIPEKLQERLLRGQSVSVQTLVDGTFPLRTDIVKGYVIAINSAFSEERLAAYFSRRRGIAVEQAEALVRPIKLEVRYLYNEEVRSTWSMVPALVMFTLMVSSPLLTALGIVREKETGSIYNIYSSTVTRFEFLAGKLLPYVAISSLNAVVLWCMATLWFRVPFKGSLPFFLAASVVFVLCSTGIGLLVSLLVRTQIAALVITMVASMLPTILYSGLIVPVSSLSSGSQFQAHLFPGMYYTNIVRGTFLKGIGLEVLWVDVLALAIYALILRTVGYQLFTKRPRS